MCAERNRVLPSRSSRFEKFAVIFANAPQLDEQMSWAARGAKPTRILKCCDVFVASRYGLEGRDRLSKSKIMSSSPGVSLSDAVRGSRTCDPTNDSIAVSERQGRRGRACAPYQAQPPVSVATCSVRRGSSYRELQPQTNLPCAGFSRPRAKVRQATARSVAGAFRAPRPICQSHILRAEASKRQ